MIGLSLPILSPWLLDTMSSSVQAGLRIILIIAAAYIGVRFIGIGMTRLESLLVQAGEGTETVPGSARKRVATLTSLLRTIALALVWAVAGVVTLAQVGLDITPILAGAGIVGLAVGFGAQNLVRDLISGFFIVLEDQVHVGDVAIINGTGGLVERITFRTIVLRDLAGVVHVFPHGTINTLANMTRQWSAYVIDVGVAYEEDTDRVVEVMREVAAELKQDPAFTQKMIEPIEIFGVDDFKESEVVMKARLKTIPMEQWTVGREYRRRLKKAFDARGIEIPFPQRSFTLSAASAPVRVHLEPTAAQATGRSPASPSSSSWR
jgi:small conductance mechanosensitive channel